MLILQIKMNLIKHFVDAKNNNQHTKYTNKKVNF